MPSVTEVTLVVGARTVKKADDTFLYSGWACLREPYLRLVVSVQAAVLIEAVFDNKATKQGVCVENGHCGNESVHNKIRVLSSHVVEMPAGGKIVILFRVYCQK